MRGWNCWMKNGMVMGLPRSHRRPLRHWWTALRRRHSSRARLPAKTKDLLLMRMQCAPSAWMESVRTAMSSCSVICAIWPFIRSATECPTSLKDSGCVAAACSPPPAQLTACCALIRVVLLNRQMMGAGPTLCVPSGFRRWVLLTQCFWNPLTAWNAFHLLVRSWHATSASSEVQEHAFSVIRRTVTQPSM